ncbi:MAG: hypothetical protein ACRD63_00130, partial [Pyrinomonadaceae bacterium]
MIYPQRGEKLGLGFALHYENRGEFPELFCIDRGQSLDPNCRQIWHTRGSGFTVIERNNLYIRSDGFNHVVEGGA